MMHFGNLNGTETNVTVRFHGLTTVPICFHERKMCFNLQWSNYRNYPYYVTTLTDENSEKPLPKLVLKVNKEKKSKTEGSSTNEEHGHHKKKKKKHKHRSEEVSL